MRVGIPLSHSRKALREPLFRGPCAPIPPLVRSSTTRSEQVSCSLLLLRAYATAPTRSLAHRTAKHNNTTHSSELSPEIQRLNPGPPPPGVSAAHLHLCCVHISVPAPAALLVPPHANAKQTQRTTIAAPLPARFGAHDLWHPPPPTLSLGTTLHLAQNKVRVNQQRFFSTRSVCPRLAVAAMFFFAGDKGSTPPQPPRLLLPMWHSARDFLRKQAGYLPSMHDRALAPTSQPLQYYTQAPHCFREPLLLSACIAYL